MSCLELGEGGGGLGGVGLVGEFIERRATRGGRGGLVDKYLHIVTCASERLTRELERSSMFLFLFGGKQRSDMEHD